MGEFVSGTKSQVDSYKYAFLFGVGIGLFTLFVQRTILFFGSQPLGLTAIGITNGLTLVSLLLSKRRIWPVTLIIVFFALAIGNLLSGSSPAVSLAVAFMNCAEALLAAWLLDRWVDTRMIFQRAEQLLRFFGAVLFSAVLLSLIGAFVAAFAPGKSFGGLWLNWWIADSLGLAFVAPLVLAWLPAYNTEGEENNWPKDKLFEGSLLIVLLVIVSGLLFLFKQPNLGEPTLWAYLLFPFLLWAGLRFNQRYVIGLLGFICMLGFFGTLNGLGQFAEFAQSADLRLFEVQVYLGVLVLTTLTLSVVFKDLNQTGDLLARSEAKYRDLFINAPIGIFHSVPGGGFIMVNPALAAMLRYETPQEVISAVTNIPAQLYVDSLNYQGILENTLTRQDWAYSVNHYRRKDGSLMVGKLSVRRVLASDGSLAYLEGFVEDITERKRTEDALKQSEALLNESQAIAKVGGWEFDCFSQKVAWTHEVYNIYGVPYDFDPNNPFTGVSFYHPEDRGIVSDAFNQAVSRGQIYDLETRFLNSQGEQVWVRTRGHPVLEKGRVVKVIGTIMDISERKRAQDALMKSEEQLRLAMEASTDGLWDQNILENYTFYSPGYCRMLGYSPDEIPTFMGGWLKLVHPEDVERVRKVNDDCRESRIPGFEIEMRMRTHEGNWKWILSRGRPVRWDANGKPLRIIGTHVDITERKQAEEALRRANRKLEKQAVANEAMQSLLIELATHDALTGLYNRRFMNDALQREIARANREAIPVSILMLDIDHFKYFNDAFGHEAGDLVLVSLSGLLRQSIRESDVACRYGGEEFIVIMPGASVEDARRRAEILCQDFSAVRIGSEGLSATISIGLAVYPQHGVGVDELLRSVDSALYTAKAAGRNCVRVR